MKERLLLFLLILLCFSSTSLAAQELHETLGFRLLNNKKSVEIPFKEVNNLIVVPIVVDNKLPLQFVLDTGVKTAILTDRIYADLLQVNYVRKLTLRGVGKFPQVEAYVASDVSLTMPDIEGSRLSILVLEDDYLDLSSKLGFKVDGILGYEFFSQFVVKIDYERQLLTIYDPDHFKPSRRYEKVQLTVDNTKPFVEFMLREREGGKRKPVRLMLDTGASHALLLHQDENNQRYQLPEKTLFANLGRGLGGDLYGNVGRVKGLELQDFFLTQVLTSYPIDSAYGNLADGSDRGGTIGGNFLNRFTVILDYQGNSLYLKKGKRFKEPFLFNKTGLTLSAKGPELNIFEVQEVLENSPACKAGIQAGDKIIKINGRKAENLKLFMILDYFGKREGKKIRLLMERDGNLYKVQFRLKDVI